MLLVWFRPKELKCKKKLIALQTTTNTMVKRLELAWRQSLALLGFRNLFRWSFKIEFVWSNLITQVKGERIYSGRRWRWKLTWISNRSISRNFKRQPKQWSEIRRKSIRIDLYHCHDWAIYKCILCFSLRMYVKTSKATERTERESSNSFRSDCRRESDWLKRWERW